jgi:hypothetical protein
LQKKIKIVFQFGSYSTPVWLLGQGLLISNYFTPSRPGWQMLDIAKLKLNSASLVELWLGLSLAKMKYAKENAQNTQCYICPKEKLNLEAVILIFLALHLHIHNINIKQAGGELCQAQAKLASLLRVS